MDKLLNLAEYKNQLSEKISLSDLSDCVLPDSFKEAFKSFGDYEVAEYYKYTIKISSKKSVCYIPNQWIYIAAICSEYCIELKKYKQKLKSLGIGDDDFESCHPSSSDKNVTEEQRSQEFVSKKAAELLSSYDGEDKDQLISFLWDYDSWGGGKNIKRDNDFTVSPCLNVANSINSSSSLIGEIAKAIGDNSSLYNSLMNSEEMKRILRGSLAEKKELVRIRTAAGFIKEAMKETIKRDMDLSLLAATRKYSKTNKNLLINGYWLGRDKSQLPLRTSDVFLDVEWPYEDKTYVLNVEMTPEGLEKQFFPVFNDAYKNRLYMMKDANSGDFVLYEVQSTITHTNSNNQKAPLQQIFYGAPGTGKSHRVNEVTEAQPEENVFRTTFHPDSDYSTFVGCYKPTKEPSLQKQPILDYDSLVDKLKEYLAIEPVNITRSCALFGYDYHDSIVKMQDGGGHTIPSLVADAYKSGTTYDSTVRAGMSIYESGAKTQNNSSTITYTFVPQAFTKAYIRAWQTEEPVYLVIEEINRGNCAQIFGDLFQLLDRKEGNSEYPIKPDTDLGNFIAEKLSSHVDGAPEKVVNGELMILPKNLCIWATMNTSDQSLFPIDSAFKRRWDWVYIPISASDEDYFGIKVGKHFYDWGKFISRMNLVVADVTSSEDKQLGYYFCKADEDGNIISANRFVNKVLFYLWNDVFKNYGFEAKLDGKDVFKYKNDEGKDDTMSFTSFYISNGLPNVKQIKRLMDNLGLEGFNEWPAEKAEENTNDGTAKLLSVTYNDNVVDGASNKEIFVKTLELIVKDRDADEVAKVIGIEMTKNPPSQSETTRDYKKVGNSDWYVATNNGKGKFLRHLINLANNLELNLVAQ